MNEYNFPVSIKNDILSISNYENYIIEKDGLMLNFIICEDDKNMVELVKNIIKTYMLNHKYDFHIGFTTDSTEGVIDYIQENINKKNIYILDIDLKNNENGMTLAKEIRKYDDIGEIIFLTSHANMLMYIFKYKLKALDFIDKQDNIQEKLTEDLNVIISRLYDKTSKESLLQVKSGAKMHSLKFDEIINIQTTGVNGKLRASTINGQIEFYGYLKNIELELDKRFFRSHKACIVNKDYIQIINKEKFNLYILMTTGEKSLLSRNYIKGLINEND